MRAFVAKARVPQQSAQVANKLQRPVTDNIRGRTAPASVHQVVRSTGHPLDRETRTLMESRFGHDFSRIRVHVDSQAADSARELGAKAYTVGQDIAFAQSQYAPNTANGQRLLAHELAHTLQQSSKEEATVGLRVAPSNDPLEHEAEGISNAMFSGGSAFWSSQVKATAQRSETPALQRAPDPDKSPKKEEGSQGSGSGQTSAPAASPVPAKECKPPTNIPLPCKPQAVSEADFVKAGAPGDALGFTHLAKQGPPLPEVKTRQADKGTDVVILKTEAKPFPCDSFFLQAGKQPVARVGFFDENDPKQKDNIAQCGKTYTATYVITDDAAKKIQEAELEHCQDYKRAFDISLGCYANVVNDLAAKKTRFASEQDAIAEVTKRVGLAPTEWGQHYFDLIQQSEERDTRKWHTAIRPPGPGLQVEVHDRSGKPGPHPCVASQSETLDESSFPQVGIDKRTKKEKHPSSEIIK
ncbi:MAG TPA: DUF4157 domain-containing protein [Candidatus Angelobacter sp.]|nr:DUF4157 domain-containing protein [Candidatus Angelobacter sp.]